MDGRWTNLERDFDTNEPAIRVSNVSKTFKLYKNPITGPIKRALKWGEQDDLYDEFHALDSIDMEVNRGEVVGIIGLNGSGKTTLLKMVAGLLPFDSGEITVNGRITALLALGVGVHPEFTGRENIYYSGLLYGIPREEVLANMETIVDFAEIGQHIDQPFRTYSSGMRARLLFSIAMSVNPDVMIVDEALSTGDAYFVKKSAARIRELCDSGATILFVTHNHQQIEELCERAIVLEEGRMVGFGPVLEQMAGYHRVVHREQGAKAAEWALDSYANLSGTGEIEIKKAYLRRPGEDEDIAFYTGEAVEVVIDYESTFNAPREVSAFVGFDLVGDKKFVAEIHTDRLVRSEAAGEEARTIEIQDKGTLTFRIDSLPLLNNHYSLWIILHAAERGGPSYCEVRGVSGFYVSRRAYAHQFGGPISAVPAAIEKS